MGTAKDSKSIRAAHYDLIGIRFTCLCLSASNSTGVSCMCLTSITTTTACKGSCARTKVCMLHMLKAPDTAAEQNFMEGCFTYAVY